MKKTLLLTAIMVMVPLMANASVTVEEQTNVPRLMNNGYSFQTAELIQVNKARANGVEYYTDGEKNYESGSKFAVFWKKLYGYFDPAAENYAFYHHDTSITPTYTDL